MKKIVCVSLLMLGFITAQDVAQNQLELMLNNKAEQIAKEETLNNPVIKTVPEAKKATVKNVEKAESFTFNSLHYQILFLLNASFLAAMIVVLRRRKLEMEKLRLSDLKKNIKKLRAEKFGSFPNKKLANVRTGLFKRKIKVDTNGINITTVAKKLSISKGEVHLAAKINLLYEQHK